MRYQKSHQNITVLVCIVLMLVSVGCQSSLWSSKNIKGEQDKLIPTSGGEDTSNLQPTPQPEAGVNTGQPAVGQQPTKPRAVTPQQIMAEVRELGSVSATAQAALMQELEKADPDIWPSVVQNFRSRLAMGERFHNEAMLATRLNSPNTGPTPNQDPRYVSQSPYYANQPIPNTNSYPSQAQPSQYTSPYPGQNQNQNQNQSYPQYRNAYPQPTAPRQNPTPSGYPPQQTYPNTAPQNQAMPLQQPNSSSQPMPVYPRTSAKSTDAGVIQASYEASSEESPSGETRRQACQSGSNSPLMEEDWRALLTASIDSLQKELNAEGEDRSEENTATVTELDQIRLRLMLLAAGRGTEAVEPISGESEAITDFWANQMFGMSTLLDERKASDPALRNTSAKHKLADALNHLGKASSLEVRSLAFCKAVNGFANIEQFDKYTFKSGQQVILYAELENLKYEETAAGYQTSLSVGYQIFDAKDHRVADQPSSSSEESSSVLRRDYYVSQLIRLPERLYPGRHILKLTVEDKLGQKYGESIIEFDVQ